MDRIGPRISTLPFCCRSHNETLSSSRCAAAIQLVCAWNKLSRAREGPDAVLGIVDHLRRRSARFKLCAHLLD